MGRPISRPPTPVGSGLYDPAAEHDACGVAFVATLRGTPGRDIVDAGLTALLNLDHRGAVGAEENSGDGAGKIGRASCRERVCQVRVVLGGRRLLKKKKKRKITKMTV